MPAPTLGLDDADLASCVQCGLCLPHCPTWRVSGEELRSPRGRIALMRSVQWDGATIEDGFVESMSSCVGCRGCEPVCPSDVPFGRMLSATRVELARRRGAAPEPWWRRQGYRLLGRHRALAAGAAAVALGQRAGLVPARWSLPRLDLRPTPLAVRRPVGSRGTVWLLRGCVMDVTHRRVHQATCDLLALAGYTVRWAQPHEGCCGALAHHAGLEGLARRQAARLMTALEGDDPVVVNAAGCGAHLRELGTRLGTSPAMAFSARVVDAGELLARVVDELPPPRRSAGVVVVQDPCHLRHVQRVHESVRTLLAPYAEVRELDDQGLCCGAGGAYAVLRPDDARAIRDRKLSAIARSGAPLVVSANPGCDLYLSAAGVVVRHPVEVVADAIAPRSALGGDERVRPRRR